MADRVGETTQNLCGGHYPQWCDHLLRAACRLAFNPVKKETFQEGINPDGTPHSKWKGYYYTVRARVRVWVPVRIRSRLVYVLAVAVEGSSAVYQRLG